MLICSNEAQTSPKGVTAVTKVANIKSNDIEQHIYFAYTLTSDVSSYEGVVRDQL